MGFMVENLLENKINQLMSSNLDNNLYYCLRNLRFLGAIYQLRTPFEGIKCHMLATLVYLVTVVQKLCSRCPFQVVRTKFETRC